MKNDQGSVRFILDGEIRRAEGVPADTTLLDYLRESLGRTGTKEGCAEGDCGACTVLLGERCGERIDWKTANACIRLLPTVDGREVATVESLRQPDGSLHPVQQAMVDAHASQCGFCTPGFVMTLLGLYLEPEARAREALLDGLAGNLCRCTGYRSIVDAALAMRGHPEPARWSRAEAQSPERLERLASIERRETLQLGDRYAAPRSLDELAARFEATPDAVILAGGTDLALRVTKELADLAPVLWIGEVAELKSIRETDGTLEIGAAVSLEAAFSAIVARWPALHELASRFASPPIRHSGTLAGNVANGSPIGDSMPALLALGASVALRRGNRIRRHALEDFYLGYRKTALEPGEFVAAITIPLPRKDQRVACYKLAKRHDQDISAVLAAFAIEVVDGRIAAARLGFGGMAAIPTRAPAAEAALVGQPWSAAAFDAAAAALAADLKPIDDLRASAAYRLDGARRLMKRFFLEQAGNTAPLRVDAVEPT